MSDQQIPNAEEQAPSIESIFAQFQGLPAEQQVPALAAILQAVIGQLAEVDGRLQEVCSKHDDLDKEIHEDFFGPIHQQYTAGLRTKGIDGLKQKYGSKFDEISGPLQGLGVEDIYGKLYDYLEELKKGSDWKDEMEGPTVEGIHSQAMERIGKVRGEPKAEEKPTTEVEASVEKKPEGSIKDKLSAGKKRSGILSGY
jgi:hypothetical protein